MRIPPNHHPIIRIRNTLAVVTALLTIWFPRRSRGLRVAARRERGGNAQASKQGSSRPMRPPSLNIR